jgi:hypothetical protein
VEKVARFMLHLSFSKNAQRKQLTKRRKTPNLVTLASGEVQLCNGKVFSDIVKMNSGADSPKPFICN